MDRCNVDGRIVLDYGLVRNMTFKLDIAGLDYAIGLSSFKGDLCV
ncbi:hypothetical protein DSUL_60005 [Desulfovibrionales bacterium]